MLAPSPPALRKLQSLHPSSSKFQDQLNDLLRGEDYQECVRNLEGGDLVWLVEYLDKALGRLDPFTPASQRCLRELKTICGAKSILPTSYNIFSTFLKVGSTAVASGDCDVYKGTYRGSKVCVKRVRTGTSSHTMAKPLYQEAAIWKHLKHSNITPFKGVTTDPLQLISDWMHGGDLLGHIKNKPDADRLELLSDAVDGLNYLHSRNVIHGNLKGSNILVDANGHARIMNFSFATVSSDMDPEQIISDQSVESHQWSVPEVLEGGTTSKEADVFSFAMVFTGTASVSDIQPVAEITQSERPPRPTHPDVTGRVWGLIKQCWDEDPHSRPKASEVLRTLLDSNPPAWKRLIDPALSTDERVDLIKLIFSDRDEVEVFKCLSRDDSRAFVDAIGEALESADKLPPDARRRFLRSSYRICRREAFLPKSLQIPLCFPPRENPDYKGGLADVWKGQHERQRVAAKALRVFRTSDIEQIRRWFSKEVLIWKSLRHPNVLPLLGVTVSANLYRFVMVTQWMENGNIHQFLNAHPNANRLELLQEVTRGLNYLHDRGVVHGDLKGDNILIDNDGHAILADFSLITLISDQQSFASTCLEGGTVRWMSPELMDPESYGLRRSRPTKKSDCYALGMVIYEILGERPPYDTVNSFAILRKVLAGERPERPWGVAGERITNRIWEVVELCWKAQPGERPDVKDVLLALEGKAYWSMSPNVSVDVVIDGETDVETDVDD